MYIQALRLYPFTSHYLFNFSSSNIRIFVPLHTCQQQRKKKVGEPSRKEKKRHARFIPAFLIYGRFFSQRPPHPFVSSPYFLLFPHCRFFSISRRRALPPPIIFLTLSRAHKEKLCFPRCGDVCAVCMYTLALNLLLRASRSEDKSLESYQRRFIDERIGIIGVWLNHLRN